MNCGVSSSLAVSGDLCSTEFPLMGADGIGVSYKYPGEYIFLIGPWTASTPIHRPGVRRRFWANSSSPSFLPVLVITLSQLLQLCRLISLSSCSPRSIHHTSQTIALPTMLSALRTAGVRQSALRARAAPFAATRALSIWNNIPQGPPVSSCPDLTRADLQSEHQLARALSPLSLVACVCMSC